MKEVTREKEDLLGTASVKPEGRGLRAEQRASQAEGLPMGRPMVGSGTVVRDSPRLCRAWQDMVRTSDFILRAVGHCSY